MFSLIQQLQELIKSYYIALTYDTAKAASILQTINDLRLQVAIDAEMREIFYSQVNVPANASGFQENVWFSRNDISYIVNRGLADLLEAVTVSAVNQGNRQRIITREPLKWQQLFAATQNNTLGQQTLFDLPQEIQFQQNEALGLSITGQTDAGFIFFHGCTLKDNLEDVRRQDLANEIAGYLPEPQLIPILFQFPSNAIGTIAINAAGGDQIFSTKYDRSIVITEVSTTASRVRFTLTDEARNQLICERVEARGIASNFENKFTTYYKLPYPHLLRKGDRLRADILNGSLMTNNAEAQDTVFFLTFKGYSM
jgi:hypothetical protein